MSFFVSSAVSHETGPGYFPKMVPAATDVPRAGPTPLSPVAESTTSMFNGGSTEGSSVSRTAINNTNYKAAVA